MASSSTDPDDATATLIAQMIAADLDAEDVAQSYHNSCTADYNDSYGDPGDEEYDDHTDSPYEAEPESAPLHSADGTGWEHDANLKDPDEPSSSTAQAAGGSWDSSEAPFPVKRAEEKITVAQNQQHEKNTQTDETPAASGLGFTPFEGANEPPNLIPKPLTINHVAISHEDVDAYFAHQPASNAPGKRRADSPPAYRLPHRPHPFPQSPSPSPPPPWLHQPTEPNPARREIDVTMPSDGWGEPALGSEDWDLLEIKIPWPGSERGYGASRVAEIEEEMRRREDAAVVEVRVGEGEDLWILLGELCLVEERRREGGGGCGGGEDAGRGEEGRDMEGKREDGFGGLRRWGVEGWVVGGVW